MSDDIFEEAAQAEVAFRAAVRKALEHLAPDEIEELMNAEFSEWEA